MKRRLSAAPAMLVAVVATAGCELSEIVFAVPDDIVVAEVVLHAGATVQTAYLHRTATGEGTARVLGARVFVRDEERATQFELHGANDSVCLVPPPPEPAPGMGTCHAAAVAPDAVRPGATYTLHIQLLDRPPLHGTTTVPGAFDLTRPGPEPCYLEPNRPLLLAWTASTGAWVYLAQARFAGLADALRAAGAPVDERVRDPVSLLGLAIGSADTTLAFPAGFGLFDRADDSLHGLLLLIRGGLPYGVGVELAVAAADRNYVNWVRGGAFNPSGTVRVPSISGGGTGVFGSLVTRRGLLHTADAALNPCPS